MASAATTPTNRTPPTSPKSLRSDGVGSEAKEFYHALSNPRLEVCSVHVQSNPHSENPRHARNLAELLQVSGRRPRLPVRAASTCNPESSPASSLPVAGKPSFGLTRSQGDLDDDLPITARSQRRKLRQKRLGDLLLLKISAFADQREEEKRRLFQRAATISVNLVFLGVLGAFAGELCNWLLSHDWVGDVILVVAHTLLVCGLVAGSACPADILDLDATARRSPGAAVAFLFLCTLVAVTQARHFPHVGVMTALFGVGACLSTVNRCPASWPPTTTFLALFLVSDIASAGFRDLFAPSHYHIGEEQELVVYSFGCFYLVTASVVLGMWAWRTREFRKSQAQHGAGPTPALTEVFYAFCTIIGAGLVVTGLVKILLGPHGFTMSNEGSLAGIFDLTKGSFTVIPAVVVVLLGRDRLFVILGGMFDKDGSRLRRDGAFIAELLETIPFQVGQQWWVHRDEEDERYPEFDHRRWWEQGLVTNVLGDSEFEVQLPAQQAEPGNPVPSDNPVGWTPSTVDEQHYKGPRVRVQVPFVLGNRSMEELLHQAQKDLRCVDFGNLRPELMRRVDARDDPELQKSWHALSRPLKPGEQIDFFVSNSWYDDPESKWEKLNEVARNFYRRYGRYPSFWIDKLCINQLSITDGLKVLPVNVMACRKLLALCGRTYLARLWCIWELFTLFAFVSEASALERVEFVFLGSYEEGLAMLDSMKAFHVKDAHCHDPNEEVRLRQVIDAVGTSHFNSRIASLASATRQRLEQKQRNGSFRGRLTMGSCNGYGLEPPPLPQSDE